MEYLITLITEAEIDRAILQDALDADKNLVIVRAEDFLIEDNGGIDENH